MSPLEIAGIVALLLCGLLSALQFIDLPFLDPKPPKKSPDVVLEKYFADAERHKHKKVEQPRGGFFGALSDEQILQTARAHGFELVPEDDQRPLPDSLVFKRIGGPEIKDPHKREREAQRVLDRELSDLWPMFLGLFGRGDGNADQPGGGLAQPEYRLTHTEAGWVLTHHGTQLGFLNSPAAQFFQAAGWAAVVLEEKCDLEVMNWETPDGRGPDEGEELVPIKSFKRRRKRQKRAGPDRSRSEYRLTRTEDGWVLAHEGTRVASVESGDARSLAQAGRWAARVLREEYGLEVRSWEATDEREADGGQEFVPVGG